MPARGAVPSGPSAGGWATRLGGCSVKGGDGLHLVRQGGGRTPGSAGAHWRYQWCARSRRRVARGSRSPLDPDCTTTSRLLVRSPERSTCSRTQLSSPPAERLGPDVLSFEGNGRQGGPPVTRPHPPPNPLQAFHLGGPPAVSVSSSRVSVQAEALPREPMAAGRAGVRPCRTTCSVCAGPSGTCLVAFWTGTEQSLPTSWLVCPWSRHHK